MSEPDAVPLPREGEVFFDVRGESRTMRLSWYADSSVAVFSIWQGNRCTSTFRLPFGDLARMVETLQAGPPSREPDRHPGVPSYASAGSDPGYGYAEPAGYGDQATYAGAPGYGSGPQYGTGPAYGYEPGQYGAPADAGGQYYGDYERPAAGPGRRSGEGHGEPDEYYAPRYVPDVAPPAPYQPDYQGPRPAARRARGQRPARRARGRAGPQGPRPAGGPHGSVPPRPDGPGYERTGAYAHPSGYAQPPGYPERSGYDERSEYAQGPDYGQPGDYDRPPEYAAPRGYADSAHGRYQHDQQYRGEPDTAYRAETQFLAAPHGPHGAYQEGAPTRAWPEDQPDPQREDARGGYAHSAKTEQATTDWGPAAASYRAR